MSHPETSARHPFTAAQYAAALGISPRAVRLRLRNVRPDARVIVRGQEADAWSFEVLPPETKSELSDRARRGGYRNAEALLAAPAVPWQPEVALASVAASELARAETLRRAFAPTFAHRINDLNLTEDRFITLGVEDYVREFTAANARKVTISSRQWRRIFDRIVARAGAEGDFTRLEIYLTEKPARRVAQSTPAAPSEFRELADYVQHDFKDSLHPTPAEQAAFWHFACALFFRLVNAGKPERRLRRQLSGFLWCSIPNACEWLSATPDALRINLARKLDRYQQSGGDRAAFNDGRRQRKGTPTAEPFDREQIDIIASHAVNAHRGRLAPALRESIENGWVTQPRIVEPMSRDNYSKSHVPRALREQFRDVPFLHELTKGKRAEAALKPPLTLEYDGIYSMDCIVADDFTMPVYFWIPDGQGWYTLTRGQLILVCDFRTLRVLNFALRPAKQYDAATVLRTFRDTFRNFGLPKFILREGGLWRRAKMINALEGNRSKELPFSAAEFEQRMAGLPSGERTNPVRFVEEGEAMRGLADLRPQFREAYCARAKPVERVGGLLQDKMGGEPGYCGRDERRDCPEETRKAKLAVESKKVSPQEAGFYSFEQWNDRLAEIVEVWNNEPHGKQARRIPGMSPAEAFEERFWPHSDPPAQLGPESEFLLATERIPDVPIKGHGILLHNGKFKYCDEQTGARIGQKVIAFFDHLSPETCTFTDVNMKNPFTVARHVSANALYPDDRTEKAMAQAHAHHSALGTRFNVLKAKRPQVFRRNIVDPRTAVVGRKIQEVAAETARKQSAQANRKNNVQRRAATLRIPAAIIDTETAGGDEGTRLMLEARRDAEREGETS